MLTRLLGGVLFAGLLLPIVASAAGQPAPGDCPNDTKAFGPIALSTEDRADAWWGITRVGLEDAGIAPADFESTIEGFFGTSFANLDDAVQALVDVVVPFDENGNGYICAYELRGRRAYLGDPLYAFYTFGVTDDKVRGLD